MDKKKISRFLKNWLGFIAFQASLFFVAVIPLNFLYKISELLGKFAYYLSARHRSIAKEGLEIAFGNSLGSREKKKIIIDCFKEIAKGGLETVYLLKHPDTFRIRVTLTGSEHLKEALARGKGVICVTAHFGNFILLVQCLSSAGFRMVVNVRPLRDERMDRYLAQKRKEFNIESVCTKPPKECVDKSLAFLRQNAVLLNLLDQNFGSANGVFVDFFGKSAATASGPVVLGLRSKAAILPVFIIRKPDNSQEVIIESEFLIEKKDDFQETVSYNIAKLTKIIEGYVRRYPAQWSWIHRRWKSRPQVRP
ncbi:MAG: lysophospholipid acyltransferase family protein [Candidatus Omnitrophota bacterium]